MQYLLIYSDDEEPLYEIYKTISDLWKHLVGMKSGIIYRRYDDTAPWEHMLAFNEQCIQLNRELDHIPEVIIKSLY